MVDEDDILLGAAAKIFAQIEQLFTAELMQLTPDTLESEIAGRRWLQQTVQTFQAQRIAAWAIHSVLCGEDFYGGEGVPCDEDIVRLGRQLIQRLGPQHGLPTER